MQMKHLGLVVLLATTLCACSEDGTPAAGGGGSAGSGGGAAGRGGDGGSPGGGGSGGDVGTGGQGGSTGAGGGGGMAACTPREAPALTTQTIAQASGRPKWSLPVFLTQAPDAPELYVVEQTGRVWPVRGDTSLDDPFLDLSSVVNSGYEEGLLGLAFHPDYNRDGDPDSGRFFVFYTENDGSGSRNVVAEYRRSAGDPLVADPIEVRRLVDIYDRYSNHNGGMLTFGDDGFLYASIGDEGSGGDPQNNGQDLSTLFGTILRLDVDASDNAFAAVGNPFSASSSPPGDPRIWHYGLRNAWALLVRPGDRRHVHRRRGPRRVGRDQLRRRPAPGRTSAGAPTKETKNYRESEHPHAGTTFPIRVISHDSDPIVEQAVTR